MYFILHRECKCSTTSMGYRRADSRRFYVGKLPIWCSCKLRYNSTLTFTKINGITQCFVSRCWWTRMKSWHHAFSLHLFILARLWSKFSQLILITLESTSWNQPVLVSYEKSCCGVRTHDLEVARQTPYSLRHCSPYIIW